MTDEIKKRIEQTKNSEVPEGYQIQHGYVVPTEWAKNTCKLRDRFSRNKQKNNVGNTNVLTISAQQGLISQEDYYKQYIASEEKSNYSLLRCGDFAYNKSYSAGYDYGAIKRLDKYEMGIVSPLYICFRKNKDTISDYYNQYFESGIYNREIYKIAQEGARNHGLLNVAIEEFFDGYLINPPIVEQEKIAEILTHCDKVIELKKQLIAEERGQKKWLIQNLLKRHKHWEKTTIGKLTIVCAGATPSTKIPEYWGGNIRWMNSGELNLKQVYEVDGRITEAGLKNSGTKLLPANCVLVGLAGQGKTRGTVAINHVPLCTNQSIAAILPNDTFNTEYLYWNLENRYVELRKISSGDGARGGLNLELINGLTIYLPPIEEQTVIANILSTTELKIELLEQELGQWLQKKKSLMQLLLTGIVRVNV